MNHNFNTLVSENEDMNETQKLKDIVEIQRQEINALKNDIQEIKNALTLQMKGTFNLHQKIDETNVRIEENEKSIYKNYARNSYNYLLNYLGKWLNAEIDKYMSLIEKRILPINFTGNKEITWNNIVHKIPYNSITNKALIEMYIPLTDIEYTFDLYNYFSVSKNIIGVSFNNFKKINSDNNIVKIIGNPVIKRNTLMVLKEHNSLFKSELELKLIGKKDNYPEVFCDMHLMNNIDFLISHKQSEDIEILEMLIVESIGRYKCLCQLENDEIVF